MVWKKLKFNQKNTLKGKIPNKPGIYFLFNDKDELLYTGHASRLRHRVQSYNQKDDFNAHPTKPHLRGKIDEYAYCVMPEKRARRFEKQFKLRSKFNFK